MQALWLPGVGQRVLRSPGPRLLPGGQRRAGQRHQREPGLGHPPRNAAHVRLHPRLVRRGFRSRGLLHKLRVSVTLTRKWLLRITWKNHHDMNLDLIASFPVASPYGERDTDTDTDTGLFAKGHRPIHKTKRGLGGQGKWNIHRLFNIQLNN